MSITYTALRPVTLYGRKFAEGESVDIGIKPRHLAALLRQGKLAQAADASDAEDGPLRATAKDIAKAQRKADEQAIREAKAADDDGA